MSQAIYWKPTNFDGYYIGSTNDFRIVLEKAFYNVPITLDESHVDILRGIRACGYTEIDVLLEAIAKESRITVYVE